MTMPHALLFTAVLASAVLVAAGARAQQASDQRTELRIADTNAVAASPAGEDAVVAPVKRVAPRTPVFTHGAAAGSGASGAKKPSQPIVPSRPNCDPGFKVDDKGTGCIKTAGSEAPKSNQKKKRH